MRNTLCRMAMLTGLALVTTAATAAADEQHAVAKVDRADNARRPIVRWRVQQRNRGFLGVHLVRLTEPLRQHFGAPADAGVLVGDVEADSPAAKAGIAVGDIIVEIGGKAIDTPQAAARQVARKRGEQVEIKAIRQGKPLTLQATPEERVKRAVTRQRWAVEDEDGDEGIELAIEGGDMDELIESLADEIGRASSGEEYQQRQAELDARLKELDDKLKQLDAAIERLKQARPAR
ncbi:MAG: PDZ domain-containing protein [Deltaproteobacteria bacterium]|nr:PDZ domain-containing protein [Deltaproteobacteria bacterium]